MAAHRYWRVLIERGAPSQTVLWVFRVELRGAGDANLSTVGNGTVTSSGSDSATINLPGDAFDTSDATRWGSLSSSPWPRWLVWDFGAGNAQDVTSVFFWSGTVGQLNPGKTAIQFSDDNATWTTKFFFHTLDGGSSFSLVARVEWDGTIGGFTAAVVGYPSSTVTADLSPRSFSGVSGGTFVSTFPSYGSLFGPYRIASTVMADVNGDGTGDVFLKRRVWLFSEESMTYVRAAWSDAATGAYSFDYLPALSVGKYTVLAYDYQRNYRAVVADNLTPEVMP